jgi:hypothetical protein
MNTKNIHPDIYTYKTGLFSLILLISLSVVSCNQDVTGSADEAITSAQITTLANLDDNLCQPGFFSENGLSPCTACPAGTYQDEAGKTFCKDAEPGSFVATEGAAASSFCPVGTYQDEAGQTSCKPAEPGSFVATEGAVQAAPCPIGTFSDVFGAAECTPCAIGETTDGPGATACILVANDPATKADCMKGGWEAFGFKNQGQCVRFIETGKDSR